LFSKSITQKLNVEKQDDFYGFWENSKDIEWSVIQYKTSILHNLSLRHNSLQQWVSIWGAQPPDPPGG